MQNSRSLPGLVVLSAAIAIPFFTPQAHGLGSSQELFSFGALPQSGRLPRGQLIEGSDGWLYGTASTGGTNNAGTLFRISKSGAGFTSLFSFASGRAPFGDLLEAADGTLWGVSSGNATQPGTVFKLNKDGSGYTVLHSFPTGANDGTQPTGNMVAGKKGFYFGVTFAGGVSNKGTVFSLKGDGASYSVLRSFGGTNDAASPYAGLCLTADDTLYGTTQAGGSNNMGTVFKLKPDGTGYAVVHHFGGEPLDGQLPLGRLVQGTDGFLYGTTFLGGSNDLGVVFKVGTNGSYTVLKHFEGGSLGSQPFAGVVQGTDGKLYGTTRYGGSSDAGTVFRVNTNSTGYEVMYDFGGSSVAGSQPLAALLLGSDSNFYGSTYWGGAYVTNGTLYRFSTSLPPAQVVITNISSGPNGYVLSFANGAAGQTYRVLATTNRLNQNWIDLGPATAAANGTFQFTDSNSASFPMRFYRSRTP